MPRQIFDDDEPLFDYSAVDDLSELGIGDRGYAMQYPPDDSNTIFGDQFERRAREIQRSPSNLQPVYQVEMKSGNWSGCNQLGITQDFSPDNNNQQTILKLDEWGFPRIWTVTLGINDYSLLNAPNPIGFAVTAHIEFGSGGTTETVEIDWLQGTSICLPMNAVNVIAKYTTGSGEGATSIPADLRLSVIVARGRTQTSQPIRTVRPAENATFIEIPKFAKNVFMCQELSLPGLNPFTFYSSGKFIEFSATSTLPSVSNPGYLTSQFVSSVDVANTLVGGPQWIPIPPFARFIKFLTALGADTTFPGVVAHFQIGL